MCRVQCPECLGVIDREAKKTACYMCRGTGLVDEPFCDRCGSKKWLLSGEQQDLVCTTCGSIGQPMEFSGAGGTPEQIALALTRRRTRTRTFTIRWLERSYYETTVEAIDEEDALQMHQESMCVDLPEWTETVSIEAEEAKPNDP